MCLHKKQDYEILNKIKPEILKGAFMSSLEVLLESKREEGKIEGKIEGIKKGKIEIAEEMIIEGYPIRVIAKLTKLTPEEIDKLPSGKRS